MTAVLNGKIYVFGGFTRPANIAAWQQTNRAWVYDPASDAWKELAAMPTPRGAGWAVEAGGKFYVIGGAQANLRGNPTAPFTHGTPQLALGTMEEYDPATNQWRSRESMPTPRNHLLAAAVNGKIYALCGRLADDTDVIEEYDRASGATKAAHRSTAAAWRAGFTTGRFIWRVASIRTGRRKCHRPLAEPATDGTGAPRIRGGIHW